MLALHVGFVCVCVSGSVSDCVCVASKCFQPINWSDMRLQSHRAPEQTDAEFGARGPHTDVWGFGTTLLHLATGQQPYKDLTLVQMVTAMTKARPPAVPDTLPAWLLHVLLQCFNFDVTKRPPVQQLLQVKPLFCVACCVRCSYVAHCCGDLLYAICCKWKHAKPSLQLVGWLGVPVGKAYCAACLACANE